MPQTIELAKSLTDFWSERGCVPRLGCSLPIPVGVMHPDAFFALAIEDPPQGSVFVQRIRRPLDGRGPDHPCRWYRHRQVVAVDPGETDDPLQVFGDSLRAAGVEVGALDLRFRAHRWTTRTLGLTGVGWRVLVGGLKVARIGWLRVVGGRSMTPSPIEVTYGLERLSVMAGGEFPPSDPSESELTRWVREITDPASLRRRLEADLRDADRCLEVGLSRPAYEVALRAIEKVDLIAAGGRLGPRGRAEMLTGIAQRIDESVRQARRMRGDVSEASAPLKSEGSGSGHE